MILRYAPKELTDERSRHREQKFTYDFSAASAGLASLIATVPDVVLQQPDTMRLGIGTGLAVLAAFNAYLSRRRERVLSTLDAEIARYSQ